MNNVTNSARAGQSGDTVGIRMLSLRLKLHEAFYQTLLERAHEMIPRLQFGVVYKSQHIFGQEFWKTLDNWHRRLAGQVLAHLVANKKLPLSFVSCRYCTTKRYLRC